MAATQYFIRVRAKVLGPFGMQQLLALRDRGQFCRFHEVSEDCQSWRSAASLPGLFDSGDQAAQAVEAGGKLRPIYSQAKGQEPAVVAEPLLWYYADGGGNQVGPVSGTGLVGLVSSGKIDRSTLVWHEGLTDWVPLSASTELPPLAPAPRRTATNQWLAWGAGCAAALLVLAAATTFAVLSRANPEANAAREQPGLSRDSKLAPVADTAPTTKPGPTSKAEVPPEPTRPPPPETSPVDVGQTVNARLLQSVVYIEHEVARGRVACGTGALIDSANRLLVTNHHVVAGAEEVAVLFPTYRNSKLLIESKVVDQQLKARDVYLAKVVYRDSHRDLALLQVDRLPENARSLAFAKTSPVAGQQVHTVGGRPEGTEDAFWIYSTGSVRQVHRKQWAYGKDQTCDALVVMHQIPTNPGNSGGPIVNNRCELVAVNSGSHQKASLVNVGIDVTEVKDVLERYARSSGAKIAP